MTHQYVVTLKNTSRRYTDTFSLLLLIISLVLFSREQILSTNIKISYSLGALAIIAIIGWNQYQQRIKGNAVSYRVALFIAAIVWITMPYLPWLFIPFVLMGMFEKQAKRPLEIGFSDDIIVINTLIRRKYSWADFNNIILKDDLLTLDFKDNRLLQRETLDEEGDAGEDEFNLYCAQQLARQLIS